LVDGDRPSIVQGEAIAETYEVQQINRYGEVTATSQAQLHVHVDGTLELRGLAGFTKTGP
jgi:hypothetical protein